MNVFWITGLPGSGKTTLAKNFQAYLRSQNLAAVLLDGDELRGALNHRFGYTREERIEASKIYINFAKIIALQDEIVIVSTVSLFQEVFDYLQHELPSSIVVFIDASTQLLDSRNQKQLRSTKVGSSPGITLSVDFPKNPKIKLFGDESKEELLSLFENLKAYIR
jgi:adenylylsulfate kinase-like enzyme